VHELAIREPRNAGRANNPKSPLMDLRRQGDSTERFRQREDGDPLAAETLDEGHVGGDEGALGVCRSVCRPA